MKYNCYVVHVMTGEERNLELADTLDEAKGFVEEDIGKGGYHYYYNNKNGNIETDVGSLTYVIEPI